MNIFGEWGRRIWYFLNRRRLERDMQREMETHRSMMDEPIRFGNVLRLREETRDVWGWNWIEDIWRDLRFAWRGLRQSPMFTLSAVFILGLGIGVNLMFFQIYNALFLKPLPVRELDSLVRLELLQRDSRRRDLGYPAAQLVRQNNEVFSALLTQGGGRTSWADDAADRLSTSFVSANWFRELGSGAVQGRIFSEDIDEKADAAPVIAIADRLWETRFNKDPNIIGKTVRINNRPAVIVGVIPSDFSGLDRAPTSTQVWIPINQTNYFAVDGYGFVLQTYARLRPGVSLNQARDAIRPVVDSLAIQYPNDFRKGDRLELYSGSAGFQSPAELADRIQFLVAVNGTVLVLIVVCANLTNLVLSRAVGRVRELSVRVALGASRSRVIRHLLAESALLAGIGSAAAFAFSYWGLRLLVSSTELPAMNLAIDWRTFVAGLAAAAVTAVAVGLIPAIEVSRKDLIAAIKDGGEQTSIVMSRSRSRKALIVAQVAGSCVLLIAAGQMLDVRRLSLTNPGYDFERVAVMDTPLAELGVKSGEAQSYWTTVRQALATNPEVESTALAKPTPSGRSRWASVISLADLSGRSANVKAVDNNFFQVMRIPIRRGRSFESSDDLRSTVIISESLAREIYGTVDAVGLGFPRAAPKQTIVGVAGDTRQLADLYVPLNRQDLSDAGLVVRANTEAERLVVPLREAARTAATNAGGVLGEVSLLRSDFIQRTQDNRFMLMLVASSSVLTLSLSCLGILGLVSYGTKLRRKEIGLRMALGANRRSIVFLLMRQLIWPVCLGVVLSIALAKVFVPGGLDGSIPMTVVLIVVAASGVAALLPGMQVSRLTVLQALRRE